MSTGPRDSPRDVAAEDDRDDGTLLAAQVAGDPDAFGVLVARHRDRLWAVALRTTGNPDDAADALQDGLVAAWRRASSFRGDAAVTTWLHRVVVNACLDRLRAQRVRAADPLPEGFGEHASAVPQAAGLGGTATADPAAEAERADRRRRLLAALASLPADQRAALVLVDLEGWSVAEAAEVLGCADGTVKSRCSRARTRLATLLADLLPGRAPAPSPLVEGNAPGRGDVASPGAPRGPPR